MYVIAMAFYTHTVTMKETSLRQRRYSWLNKDDIIQRNETGALIKLFRIIK